MLNIKNAYSKSKIDVYSEYEIKDKIILEIKDKFKSHGYKEISTSTFESYDIFSTIQGTVTKEEMFKFIDKTGEILVLRPDVTTPISKMVANDYEEIKGYLKLCYVSNIFRINNKEKINEREFTQAGVEYFGNSKPEADGEVIALAIKSLLNHSFDFKIDIGQADFYKGLIDEIDIEANRKTKLRNLIEYKNCTELKKVLKDLQIDEKIKNTLLKMPNLYGDMYSTIKEAQKMCLNEKMSQALDNLKDVYEILCDYGYRDYVSIDLGLITHLDYYTGVIFKGYIANHGSIVLSGGRYDNLVKQFGCNIPATGFGINIDEMIKAEKNIKNSNGIQKTRLLILYKKADRKAAFRYSDLIRKRGYLVETDLYCNQKKHIDIATVHGINKVIIYNEDKLKVINIDENNISYINKNEFIDSLEQNNDAFLLDSIH